MSIIQILILGVAIVIALTSIDFKKVQDFFKSNKTNQTAIEAVEHLSDEEEKVELTLVDAVAKWQEFKDFCEQLELNDAVQKLDEIFPMLIKADKE